MSVQHHISDELLLDYASGQLEESWSIAVATHLAFCPECRSRLQLMEQAGGVLLEDLGSESSAPDSEAEERSWELLKARLGTEAGQAAPSTVRESQPLTLGPAGIPEPLRSYLGADFKDLRWRALGLGAYHYPIETADKEISVRLLKIPAGKPVPEHGHGGRELTLVLEGCFVDGDEIFGPGDLEETDETVNHQPVAGPERDCICLAVTDQPLRFRSRIVRFIQPFLGI